MLRSKTIFNKGLMANKSYSRSKLRYSNLLFFYLFCQSNKTRIKVKSLTNKKKRKLISRFRISSL